MKAAICDRYGPPEIVYIGEIEKPEPGDDDILVRTRATTVNSGDARLRGASFPAGMGVLVRMMMGFSGPRVRILGFDVAGDVEAVGRNVTSVKPGDRVLASNGFKFGGHAEHLLVGAKGVVVTLPDGMSYEDAVALQFGGVTSLVFFDMGKLEKGQSILINGASGAVGVYAVQIARHFGARVTAVCSARNAKLVESLGAEAVVDYEKTDITGLTERFDVIMDNHGTAPFSRVRHLLNPEGRFLMVIGDLRGMIDSLLSRQIINPGADAGAFEARNFRRLLDLAKSGAIRPVIGKTLPFEEIVEAYRLVDTGHKVGSLVLTMP